MSHSIESTYRSLYCLEKTPQQNSLKTPTAPKNLGLQQRGGSLPRTVKDNSG